MHAYNKFYTQGMYLWYVLLCIYWNTSYSYHQLKCLFWKNIIITIFFLVSKFLLSSKYCVWPWESISAAAKSLQSCPTLCDPIDGSSPGSPVPGILQARTLEWVAISFSNAWKWRVNVKSLSRVWLFATPWTAAHQAPPSMGFSRQKY